MYSDKSFRLAPGLPENTFSSGKVRIQFISSRMVRFEWQEQGHFEDRQTLAVVNRQDKPVIFTHESHGGVHQLKTDHLSIELRDDQAELSASTLSVNFIMNGDVVSWKPGQNASGNLGATIRTLDGIHGEHRMKSFSNPELNHEHLRYRQEKLDLGKGFVSRDGWSLIDDSKSILIDLKDGRKWVTPRVEGKCQDWYLLAYGHDYTEALADAAKVFGGQPLAPRYTLGYWWSRYWAYTDSQIEELVNSFDAMKVPIDVMVIDMDWHLEGWTGYTWDRRYFPDPEEHLQWLHRHGVKATLNLHPADGVAKFEEQFPAMCEAMGLDPEKNDRVEFDITDPKYMDNYFKILHHPEEKRGIDFWWMDWQQGESTSMPGLDTLPWINQLHWEDMEQRADRNNKRPLIFSRYGGYGSGRYNVGFSGDTYSTWESLAFQPRFTATAANVLYGYWSHDIGGHMPGPIEPELYTRWIQYGIFSPVLRTHTTKNSKSERRVWEYPAPYSKIMMDAIRQRYEMAPYIYSENRKAFDTAISLCRPLYYHWPEADEAYDFKNQYMFGDSMMLAPVVKPVNPENEMAAVDIWLPEGEWFDIALGRREVGNRVISRKYMVNEVPVFVPAGAVIPGQRCVKRLDDKCYRNLALSIYPGESGEYKLYEDDGISMDYLKDASAFISMSHRTEEKIKTIRIVRESGKFDGYTPERSLEIRLEGSIPPAKVSIDGKTIEYAYRLDEHEQCWSYDGLKTAAVIKVPAFDLDKGLRIEVEYPAGADLAAADGLRGRFNRMQRINELVTQLTHCHIIHKEERLSQQLAHAFNRISRRPETFAHELEQFYSNLKRLPQVVSELTNTFPNGHYSEERMKNGEHVENMISVLFEQ